MPLRVLIQWCSVAFSVPVSLCAVIVVDPAGGGDEVSMTRAVENAANGDVIVLVPAVYYSTFDVIDKSVTVRSIDPENPLIVAATVIDRRFEPRSIVVIGGGLELSGVTVRDGALQETRAITARFAHLAIANCVFQNNGFYVEQSGGAIYLNDSTISLVNCALLGNRGYTSGSAIFANRCHLEINRCWFEGNQTTFIPRFPEEEHSRRRTIVARSSQIEMADTTIIGETVWIDGSPSVEIERCRIYQLAGVQALGIGDCPSAIVRDSLILSIGVGPESGTACITSGCNLSLTGCAIVGGTIGVSTQPPWILTARGNLFYQNGYGVIFGDTPESGYYTIRDNCFFGSIWGAMLMRYVGFIDIPGNLRVDPRVVTPGSWDLNGTPESADDLYTPGDYRLRPDSPLINAGPTDLVYGPDARDFFGRVRVAGGRVDIGYHEYPEAGDLDGDGNLTWFDVDQFVLALLDPAAHAVQFPLADREAAGDVNRDGRVDLFDIPAFVDRVSAIGDPRP